MVIQILQTAPSLGTSQGLREHVRCLLAADGRHPLLSLVEVMRSLRPDDVASDAEIYGECDRLFRLHGNIYFARR